METTIAMRSDFFRAKVQDQVEDYKPEKTLMELVEDLQKQLDEPWPSILPIRKTEKCVECGSNPCYSHCKRYE